MSLTFQAELIH